MGSESQGILRFFLQKRRFATEGKTSKTTIYFYALQERSQI